RLHRPSIFPRALLLNAAAVVAFGSVLFVGGEAVLAWPLGARVAGGALGLALIAGLYAISPVRRTPRPAPAD
ncbi:MAG: hypothetical protein AAGH15_27995, partial [Myxococcota bacterium]